MLAQCECVQVTTAFGVDPSTNRFGGAIYLARTEMSRDPLLWWSFVAAPGLSWSRRCLPQTCSPLACATPSTGAYETSGRSGARQSHHERAVLHLVELDQGKFDVPDRQHARRHDLVVQAGV